MENTKVSDSIVKVEREVEQDIENNDSGLEILPRPTQVLIKQEDYKEEEEQPNQSVQVTGFKGDAHEGFYVNTLPTGASGPTSVSLTMRPHPHLQQWKEQGGTQLAGQISVGEQQWVDMKGVVTLAAPNVGGPWITADGQNFSERDAATLVKDGNVQYVLMTSADSFYLVESGDSNAVCASDGPIKNLVTGDKNIQMISLVSNQNVTNSSVVIGNIPCEQGVVHVSERDENNVVIPTGSSGKRNTDPPTVLSTIALEDCDLKHVEPSRKRKKAEKHTPATVPTMDNNSLKKGCDLNSCPLRCTAVFDEEEREEINKAFQSLNRDEQKKFILQCCSRKILLKGGKEDHTPGYTSQPMWLRLDFQLRSGKGVPVQVCKLFFASTLGYTEFDFNCLITDLYKTSTQHQNCSCTRVINSKPRGKSSAGKWAASCKMHSDVYGHAHKDLFHRHIESFLRTLCIPQGEHMRTVRYLPKDVSIQMMYEDFAMKHPEVSSSYDLYKNFVVLFTS